jgi:hypothetical protein
MCSACSNQREHLMAVELCLLALLPARKGNASHPRQGSHVCHCLPNPPVPLHDLLLSFVTIIRCTHPLLSF